MKKIMLLLFLVLSGLNKAEAQNNRSALQVKLQTNQPITVVIDGRQFRRFGNVLTIGNMPAGRHELKVYRYFSANDDHYRPFSRNTAHARLVYRGRIRVAPSRMYYCLVNPGDGTINIRESGMVALDGNERNYPVTTDPVFSDGDQQTGAVSQQQMPDDSPAVTDDPAYGQENRLPQQQLDRLQQQVAQKITDTDKLKLIKDSLGNSSLTTDQAATMIGWLTFEDSRLELAKWCYASVADKNRFVAGVRKQFGYDSSIRELEQLAR